MAIAVKCDGCSHSRNEGLVEPAGPMVADMFGPAVLLLLLGFSGDRLLEFVVLRRPVALGYWMWTCVNEDRLDLGTLIPLDDCCGEDRGGGGTSDGS